MSRTNTASSPAMKVGTPKWSCWSTSRRHDAASSLRGAPASTTSRIASASTPASVEHAGDLVARGEPDAVGRAARGTARGARRRTARATCRGRRSDASIARRSSRVRGVVPDVGGVLFLVDLAERPRREGHVPARTAAQRLDQVLVADVRERAQVVVGDLEGGQVRHGASFRRVPIVGPRGAVRRFRSASPHREDRGEPRPGDGARPRRRPRRRRPGGARPRREPRRRGRRTRGRAARPRRLRGTASAAVNAASVWPEGKRSDDGVLAIDGGVDRRARHGVAVLEPAREDERHDAGGAEPHRRLPCVTLRPRTWSIAATTQTRRSRSRPRRRRRARSSETGVVESGVVARHGGASLRRRTAQPTTVGPVGVAGVPPTPASAAPSQRSANAQ